MARKKQKNNTNKWLTISLIIIGVLILGSILISPYNSLVALDEQVLQAWGDVETQYQRRADLIPNLVATVQGAADFESETQTAIAALRSNAEAAKAQWDNANTVEEKIEATKAVEQAASDVENTFRGFNINVENYPQLGATNNFIGLQDQLEGTENRIAVARTRYNEAVAEYNTKVRRFPSNIYAGMFGFERKTSFQASEGSENAPSVTF